MIIKNFTKIILVLQKINETTRQNLAKKNKDINFLIKTNLYMVNKKSSNLNQLKVTKLS